MAAFGSNPGAWPLAAADTPEGLWLRAVAAGGQGRYAVAEADLDELLRLAERGPLASLALSTRGSFRRQLGWHERARSSTVPHGRCRTAPAKPALTR